MNFVSARRIIAMHQYGSVRQLAKIPRSPRMIEDHLLVKLFNFGAHDGARTETPPPWEKRNAPQCEGFQSFDRSPPSCCRSRSSRELCRTHRIGASAAGCNDVRHASPARTD